LQVAGFAVWEPVITIQPEGRSEGNFQWPMPNDSFAMNAVHLAERSLMHNNQ
jgi:hypothetical protein